MTHRAPGWILLHRSMTDSYDKLWNHPSAFDVRSARLDLLVQARFADGSYSTSHGVEQLQRGEFVGSLRYFARRWRWSKSRVERYLSRCIADEFISRQRTGHHGDVYLVVNYDRYQASGDDAGQDSGRERDAGGTKEKEGNEGKRTTRPKIPTIHDRADRNTDTALVDFARFWAIYPRRSGTNSRAAAEKVWFRRRREATPVADLLAGASRYKAHCERKNIVGTEYVMTASRFLGEERHYAEDWGVGVVSSTAMSIPGAKNVEDERKLRLAGF
jgi:hypothetical protein